jgi:LacI family gluconate utilization system Gnt-I transcriptional repressor
MTGHETSCSMISPPSGRQTAAIKLLRYNFESARRRRTRRKACAKLIGRRTIRSLQPLHQKSECPWNLKKSRVVRPGRAAMAERNAIARTVTMADVALEANVAAMTVSNCYRAPARVHPETFARVAAAATKLGYLRNLVAGGLASGRSQVIGVAVPSLQNSNFVGTIQGLEDRLSRLGYQLMLTIASTAAREHAAVRAFVERRVDGIVLTGTQHDEAMVSLLKNAGVPVVETWSLKGPFLDMGVGFSLYDAAHQMAQHIVSRGYRKVGFAGLEPRETLRFLERQTGFQDALRQAGLRHDLLAFGTESMGFSAGKVAMEKLLEIEPGLDAIFCVTDVVAAGVLFECVRRGWSVPGRLGIAGYGDYEIASETSPKISTVRSPAYEMGVAAADLVVDRLTTSVSTSKVLDVGYELMLRESL